MEDHAALLVSQAAAARRAGRPAAWLACVFYDLDVNRPAGAARADALANAVRLAALLATSADWRSGHRARTGRQVAAAVLGLAEKTITRHTALLTGRQLTEQTATGQLLNAEQRAEANEDQDVSEAQRKRWTDRAEYTLRVPAWVRQVTDEQMAPYIVAALAVLDELSAPAREAVDNRQDRVVDICAAYGRGTVNVSPSRVSSVLGYLPLRRGFLLLPVAVENAPTASSPVTRKKEQGGGATRRSPTKGGRTSERGPMPVWAVRLARQIALDGRIPLRLGVDMPRVVQALVDHLGPVWTVDDVVAEAKQRLRETKKALPARLIAPGRYLDWLLSKAVPGEPPWQIAVATQTSLRQRAVDRAQQAAQRAAQAAAPDSPARLEARRVAREAAGRSCAVRR